MRRAFTMWCTVKRGEGFGPRKIPFQMAISVRFNVTFKVHKNPLSSLKTFVPSPGLLLSSIKPLHFLKLQFLSLLFPS